MFKRFAALLLASVFATGESIAWADDAKTLPDDVKTVPGDSKAVTDGGKDAKPGDVKPGDVKSGDGKAGDTKTGDVDVRTVPNGQTLVPQTFVDSAWGNITPVQWSVLALSTATVVGLAISTSKASSYGGTTTGSH